MKIVKKAGERLLPDWLYAELRPVLVFTGAGAALCAGSVVLAGRAWRWLGRRLDVWERLGAITVGGYLALYGCLHAPRIAHFAVPGTVVAWCVAAWCVAPDSAGEAPDEASESAATDPDPRDVADLVRDLVGDDRGILLTRLRQPLRAADTRAVRELLTAAGIAVRPGVRTAAGNGPGVHRDDLPAPPRPPTDPSPSHVVAGGDANTNTTNTLRVYSQEGMTIISDPADRYRAHSLKKAP